MRAQRLLGVTVAALAAAAFSAPPALARNTPAPAPVPAATGSHTPSGCGADPAVVSIRLYPVAGTRDQVNVVGTIQNTGTAPQPPSVFGRQVARLYVLGMSGYSPTTPIATMPIVPLSVGAVARVAHVMRYPFTSGDVPVQFRVTFTSTLLGAGPAFDCDRSNDSLLFTADMRPYYPLGTH